MKNKKMTAAIFGTGEIYRQIRDSVAKKYKIIAIFDNDQLKWGERIGSLKISPPLELKNYQFNKIIIASSHAKSITKQLMSMGLKLENIEIGANYIFEEKQKNKIKFKANKKITCNFSTKNSDLFWIEHSGQTILAKQHNTPTLISLWGNNNLPLFFSLSETYYPSTPGIFIDIGANIGTTTLEAANNQKVTKCISFEPESDNYSLLLANIYLNKLEKKIEAHKLAVGEKNESSIILKSPYCSGDNRIRNNNQAIFDINSKEPEPHTNQEEIKIISIDSFLSKNLSRIKYLWIDVQGYELSVLKGCQKLISNGTTAILIEYWPFGLRENNSIKSLNKFLSLNFTQFIDLQDYNIGHKTPRNIAEIDTVEKKLKKYGPNAHTDLFLIK